MFHIQVQTNQTSFSTEEGWMLLRNRPHHFCCPSHSNTLWQSSHIRTVMRRLCRQKYLQREEEPHSAVVQSQKLFLYWFPFMSGLRSLVIFCIDSAIICCSETYTILLLSLNYGQSGCPLLSHGFEKKKKKEKKKWLWGFTQVSNRSLESYNFLRWQDVIFFSS